MCDNVYDYTIVELSDIDITDKRHQEDEGLAQEVAS